MATSDEQRGGGTIAVECTAFLNGTLAEYWEDRGLVGPVWAWTNLLAHGSAARIAESMGRARRSRRAAQCWRTVRSYLAYEVFDLVDDEFTLVDMQSAVLVPIELEMSSRPEVSRWSPRQWVDAVDHAMWNQSPSLGYGHTR